MVKILLLFIVLLSLQYACGVKVVISNFTQCGKPMQDLQFSCKIGNQGFQLCSIDYSSPVENGDNFRLEIVMRILRGRFWHKLITLKEEKGMCKALFIYTKQTVEEGLESVGEPKQCPIRNGSIHVKDLPIDLSGLQGLPALKSKMSLAAKSYEKTTGKLGICAYFEYSLFNPKY